MEMKQVGPGPNAPEEINVVIEIPSRSEPVKYEHDKDTGAMIVDRFMSTAMFYPCNYGYVPQTLSEDGDPVDVLVISPSPLISGSVILCRPIALLKMTDEAGVDAKVLAVPARKLSALYDKYNSPDDVPPVLLSSISHFFEHYKDLEEDKWVKVEGWCGIDDAKKEITSGLSRYAEE